MTVTVTVTVTVIVTVTATMIMIIIVMINFIDRECHMTSIIPEGLPYIKDGGALREF